MAESAGQEGKLVQPLTKRTEKGDVLERPPEVEDQIRMVLDLDHEEIVRRSEVSDINSHEFLRPECLVYLIRVNRGKETRHLTEKITQTLVKRCVRTLRTRIVGFSPADVQDIADEIVANLIERIIEPSERGDYFEVRFAQAFKYLRIDVCRKYRIMRAPQVVRDEIKEAAAGGMDLCEAMALKDALRSLTEAEALIIELRYFSGIPINSKEQDHLTIVGITKLSERTVRNRLRSAEEKLRKAIRESKGQTNVS